MPVMRKNLVDHKLFALTEYENVFCLFADEYVPDFWILFWGR